MTLADLPEAHEFIPDLQQDADAAADMPPLELFQSAATGRRDLCTQERNQQLAQEMIMFRQQLCRFLDQEPLAAALLAQLLPAAPQACDTAAEVVQKRLLVQPGHSGAAPATSRFSDNRIDAAMLIKLSQQLDRQTAASPRTDSGLQRQVCCRQLQAVRQKMITGNTGLVLFVAYKYKHSNLGPEDLLQEGIVGLIKAVDRFDPGRGTSFSTYAVFWIRQAISRLVIKQDKVVHLPVALAEKAGGIFEIMKTTYLRHNRWPTAAELEAQCDMSGEDIRMISRYYQATHSLDEALSSEHGDLTLLETLVQRQFQAPESRVASNQLRDMLDAVLAGLPPMEAEILARRFGLRNHDEISLQRLADEFALTRERIRQLQNQALKKIRLRFGMDLQPYLETGEC